MFNRIKELFEYKDGKLFWKVRKAHRIEIGDRAGCMDKLGYRYIGIDYKIYREHRLIWLLHYGYFPERLDHINRIKDDNRIENLREVTRSQNHMNSKKRKNTTSKYKGVCWDKENNKWRSQIKLKGKLIHLGRFHSEVEAAEAYNRKAIELFGEFKQLNIIGDDNE